MTQFTQYLQTQKQQAADTELDTQIADKALINLADGGTFTGNIIANANLSVGNTTTTAGVLTLLEDDDDGVD